MKVAILAESFPNISETFILNHIKGLIDKNLSVTIFTYNYKKDIKHHNIFIEYDMGSLVKSMPYYPKNKFCRLFISFYFLILISFFKPTFIVSLIRLILKTRSVLPIFKAYTYIDNSKYDILHAHFGNHAKDFLDYKFIFDNTPLVTTFHGYDLDNPRIRKNIFFYKDLILKSQFNICNSSYTNELLIKYGFNEKKISIIPVPLDIKKFSIEKSTNHESNKNSFKIITIGRLIEVKGIIYGIKAIQKLIKEGFSIKYYIIGDGMLFSELDNYIKSNDLHNNVFLMGKLTQEKIIEFAKNVDLFILTGIVSKEGREEAQGLVIQEAQCMNLPVIVSNIGGVKEGIIDKVTGFLTPPKDVNEIAKKISFFYNNRDQVLKFGENGRNFVKKNYSIEDYTHKMLDIYCGLIKNNV